MAGAFEVATRSAISEIIMNAVQPSKFGFVMSQDGFEDICDQLFDLLVTSRNLKSAGDRLIAQGFVPAGMSSKSKSKGPNR